MGSCSSSKFIAARPPLAADPVPPEWFKDPPGFELFNVVARTRAGSAAPKSNPQIPQWGIARPHLGQTSPERAAGRRANSAPGFVVVSSSCEAELATRGIPFGERTCGACASFFNVCGANTDKQCEQRNVTGREGVSPKRSPLDARAALRCECALR